MRFSPFCRLSKNSFHLPVILSRSLKTTRCSSFIWLFLAKALAFAIRDISFFHPPVFTAPRTTHSLPAPWLCYCFLCHFVSLPVAILAFLPSWCFPHLHCLFLSLYHLLHLIIPPPCIIISWGSPPSCNAQHLLSTLKIVVLLSSHHSCTLSTGLTFSNTVSLNFILG